MDTSTLNTQNQVIQKCISLISDIVKIKIKQMWMDFDEEADVLYLSFRKPQNAKNTEEYNDDILLRKDGAEIVGVTILNASRQ